MRKDLSRVPILSRVSSFFLYVVLISFHLILIPILVWRRKIYFEEDEPEKIKRNMLALETRQQKLTLHGKENGILNEMEKNELSEFRRKNKREDEN